MSGRVMRNVGLALGVAVLMQSPAHAQGSTTAGEKPTPADVAAKMQNTPQPPKADLSKNGVDTPYTAQAGPLTLMNCGAGSISVKTYNRDDAVLWIPYQTVAIAAGASSGLQCATSECKLDVDGVKTGAISGYQVYRAGAVKTTNQGAMAQGCKVYK